MAHIFYIEIITMKLYIKLLNEQEKLLCAMF